jgi:hypothetical protein
MSNAYKVVENVECDFPIVENELSGKRIMKSRGEGSRGVRTRNDNK